MWLSVKRFLIARLSHDTGGLLCRGQESQPRCFPKGTLTAPRFLPNLTLGELCPGPSVPLSGSQSVTLGEDPPPKHPVHTCHPSS